jgi:decaprenyl-phosphate phosphoribosyltransferase
MKYIQLLRPKEWVKNSFLFIPLFFAGEIFNVEMLLKLLPGFFAFSFVASCIYILNDYRDREDDKKHPVKCKRPLAAGLISPAVAIAIAFFLLVAGLSIAYLVNPNMKFLFVLLIYLVINIGYSFGWKNIAILDIVIIASGFVFRVKSGSILSGVALSEWLIIMIFLLALFMAIGKRRDDVLIKLDSGADMRKSIKGYNLEFLNVCLAFFCAVIVVSYFMYTMSPEVIERMGTYRLYYTCLFVLCGILRYLQIVFVMQQSGSPTKIFIKDRFLQVCMLLWAASFYIIVYLKDSKLIFK